MENINLLHENCLVYNGEKLQGGDFHILRSNKYRTSLVWHNIELVESNRYRIKIGFKSDQPMKGFLLLHDNDNHKCIFYKPIVEAKDPVVTGEIEMSQRSLLSATLSLSSKDATEIVLNYAKIDKTKPLKNNNRNKRILVSSTQIPGFGGAATNAYYIIKYLRAVGYSAAGLFFDYDSNYKDLNVDPDNIGGVHFMDRKILLKNELEGETAQGIIGSITKYLGGEPNICLAKNYVAPVGCKRIFSDAYVVYLVSGINLFPMYFCKQNISTKDIFNHKLETIPSIPHEDTCNTLSDLIVTNSLLSLKLYRILYPNFNNKLYYQYVDTTDCVRFDCPLEKASPKDIDIAICCSNFNRKDKNNDYLIDLLMNPRFDKCNKIIIGSNYENFEKIPNSICTGMLSNAETKKYLARCRILLYPSLYDANSNTIREAFLQKCLPLMTTNVGFYERFPNYLVCKTFNHDEWIFKIEFILDNYKELAETTKIKFDNADGLMELINSIECFVLDKSATI